MEGANELQSSPKAKLPCVSASTQQREMPLRTFTKWKLHVANSGRWKKIKPPFRAVF